jgi:hypothetical protein
MYGKTAVSTCFMALCGCMQIDTFKSSATDVYGSPSANVASISSEYKANAPDGMPEGFIPPTGPASQALVNYINPTTGQTWTAPSGGYTVPDGWIVDHDPVE